MAVNGKLLPSILTFGAQYFEYKCSQFYKVIMI